MTINRKQVLRFAGVAAAGASAGFIARGLLAPAPFPDDDRPRTGGPASGPRPPQPAAAQRENVEAQGNVSFSQCGEDLVVAFTLGYLGCGPHITYLDVGANDPVKFNNTYYFYRHGHHGVLVEPNRSLCARLRERRKQDTVLEAGIGVTAAREADYYVMTFDGLNTFSKEEAEHQVRSNPGKVAIEEVIKMPLLDINDVMREHFQGAPTFLSIDTEGLDLAILQSLDFGRFRPKVICAETLISSTKKVRPEIAAFLETKDYVARGGSFVNTIFVDRALL